MNLYTPTTTMQPRPYQREAIDALDAHLCSKATNPCVVLPTGSGKSPVMAWTIQRYKQDYPPFRCIVLAHVKELVEQNADKMRQVWPEAPIGIFAAGLRRRQRSQCITFASIDSVYDKADQFDPFDLVMVDEAHRIPARGEGKYRRFIQDAQLQNPNLRVVGYTATPYRLGCGPICHRDHVLNEIAYNANVREPDVFEPDAAQALAAPTLECRDRGALAVDPGQNLRSLREADDRFAVDVNCHAMSLHAGHGQLSRGIAMAGDG